MAIATQDKPLDIERIFRSLSGERFGRDIVYLKSVDSTNQIAKSFGQRKKEEGALIIAESQTGGKGRMGRVWHSPPFLNLYFSLLLTPPVSPRQAGWITLLSGAVLAEAVEAETGLRPEIKWPNDLLLGGNKFAGILTELQTAGDKIDQVILGIGINVNMMRFPAELAETATSLERELKAPVDRERLLVRVLSNLEQKIDAFYRNGPGEAAEAWSRRSGTLGRKVIVEQSGGPLEGMAVALDPTGGLVIEKEDHTRVTIYAGDIIHLREG
ncbi:MAG TPA: biotin--[acetyl-CoA-carboxylase] ligase [Nitrospiria bacterium]|nr:biotin--[acetyl-CoA-carboxylase] ligase [Nitrospiria bacterium]